MLKAGPARPAAELAMGARTRLGVPGIGEIGAWLAHPDGPPLGGLVVVQEIFGVNAHMRAVTDRYAREGLLALAPALFDPVERDVELAYDEASARLAHHRTLDFLRQAFTSAAGH